VWWTVQQYAHADAKTAPRVRPDGKSTDPMTKDAANPLPYATPQPRPRNWPGIFGCWVGVLGLLAPARALWLTWTLSGVATVHDRFPLRAFALSTAAIVLGVAGLRRQPKGLSYAAVALGGSATLAMVLLLADVI
jgi:hypothetical protein